MTLPSPMKSSFPPVWPGFNGRQMVSKTGYGSKDWSANSSATSGDDPILSRFLEDAMSFGNSGRDEC